MLDRLMGWEMTAPAQASYADVPASAWYYDAVETAKAHGVNLRQLMKLLGERKIDSILLEGGGTLNASALQGQIVSKVYAYIAGKLIGGREAPSPVSGEGASRMSEAVQLKEMEIRQLGEDILVTGYPGR